MTNCQESGTMVVKEAIHMEFITFILRLAGRITILTRDESGRGDIVSRVTCGRFTDPDAIAKEQAARHGNCPVKEVQGALV